MNRDIDISKRIRTKKHLKEIVLFTILSVASFFVLLPFFWMIITALKQPGGALKFEFIPKTIEESSTYIISDKEPDYNRVIFEYYNPSAVSVTVAGDFNGWKQNKNPLEKIEDGLWQAEIKSLKQGTYNYKFVLNNSDWVADPENPEVSKDGFGNSVLKVKSGLTVNKRLENDTHIKGNLTVFSLKDRNYRNVWVIVNGIKHKLVLDENRYWKRKLELPVGEQKYKFLKKVSFKIAIDKIYSFKNFKAVLLNKDFPFGKFFINSLVVAFGSGLLTSIICLMAGYAFAKKNFYFKNQIFYFLLAAMLVPGLTFMVPQFAIVSKLKWINTYQGMIIPHLANVFGLFLLRQFISTIPDDLFEAATIDGASEIQSFFIIAVPLSIPIVVTLFLLAFIGQWSNFLWQLIVNTPDSPLITLPVGLALFKGQYAIEWEKMMAGACFSIIPIAILFLFAQRYFIEGMTRGALKE